MKTGDYVLVPTVPTLDDYLHLRAASDLTPKSAEQGERALPGSWAAVHIVHSPTGETVAIGVEAEVIAVALPCAKALLVPTRHPEVEFIGVGVGLGHPLVKLDCLPHRCQRILSATYREEMVTQVVQGGR